MKTTSKLYLVLSIALAFTGCDLDEESMPTKSDSLSADGLNVEVDASELPAENQADRRQERRENIREVIEKVDVKVGDGGVDVNVGDGDGKGGVDVRVD